VVRTARESNTHKQEYREDKKELTMKTIFIDSGLDDHLAEKIEKGQVYNNVPGNLPQKEVTVKTLYRELEKGQSFLNGFSLPGQQEKELKEALSVIAEAIERHEKRQEEPFISEEELISALDYLTEIAQDQKR
jgi:hypothetical protein